MTKTLKQVLEGYEARSADEKRFIDKHVVVKHEDRNGNGDDVFKAKKIKTINRKDEKHGHGPLDDGGVYEEVEDLSEARGDAKRASYEKLLASHGYKKNDKDVWHHPDGQRAMHMGSGGSTYLYHSVEGHVYPGGSTYKHNHFDAMGPLKKHLENLHGKPTKLKEEVLDEAVHPDDYEATHAKSQFGGYIPVVKHKDTGRTSYSGQARYKTPESAKAHAEKYRKRMHYRNPADGLDHVGDYEDSHIKLKEETLDEGVPSHMYNRVRNGPANPSAVAGDHHTTPEQRRAAKIKREAKEKLKEDTDIQEVSSNLIGRYLKAAKQDRYERFTKEAPKDAYTPKGKAISAKWKAANAERIAAGKKKLDSRNANIKKAEARLENK